MFESLWDTAVGPETTVTGLGLGLMVLDDWDSGDLNMGRGEVRLDV